VADPTEQLTAALSAGDEDAVDTFYRRYFDWLYAQARRATRRDESFCLDVVQDAVLRVMRNVRPIADEARFRAWLKLVVQAVALDRLRSDRRRRRHELTAAVLRTSDDGAAAENYDEVTDWLRREITKLDPQLVDLMELRYERRLTLARISAMLGLSIGTIDGRLRKALAMLRDRAAEEFDD
jgi:RNA polymerase sigma-70 factor (ECF subfamily)